MNIEAKLENINILTTDVDGTLTDASRKLDLRVIKKIRELENLGIPVILVTGHVFPVVSGLANYIGTSGPVVAEGGAVIGIPWRLKYTLGKPLPHNKIRSLMKSRGFEEPGSNEYRHQDLAFHRNGRNMPVSQIKKELAEENVTSVNVFDSGYAVHVAPKGVDKGKGLLKALEMIEGDIQKTVVIGDSSFDLPMYTIAGCSIASQNAPDVLQNESNILRGETTVKAFISMIEALIKAQKR